ncbi:BrnT family toxin [bacterium]|nr:BrnT family toxin [bacterium]
MKIFSQIKGFEWDEGNINKNWEKHKVTHVECEEIFFKEPLIVQQDTTHSMFEERYFALGKTDKERLLFVIFTLRGDKIRVISARDMNKKERRCYQ